MNSWYFGFFGGVPSDFVATTFLSPTSPEKLSTSFQVFKQKISISARTLAYFFHLSDRISPNNTLVGKTEADNKNRRAR
jgi:hypothetical protein